MDKISIDFKNEYLAERLAAELASSIDFAQIAVGGRDGYVLSDKGNPEYGMLLSEKFEWLPISSLVLKIMKEMGKSGVLSDVKPFRQCVFIGVSSCCGGCGQSSSAIALGRIYSRLYGFKTLLISFDRFSFGRDDLSKDEPDLQKLVYYLMSGKKISAETIKGALFQDEYGLSGFKTNALFNPLCTDEFRYIYSFLSAAADSGLFERVILDVPYNHLYVRELLALCEKKIIVSGPDDRSRKLADKSLDFFSGKKELLVHEYDEFSFEDDIVDIHGQFGAEVREIAEKIELY